MLVLGNGETKSCLLASSACRTTATASHKVLRADMRGVGLTKIGEPGPRGARRVGLASQAADAMGCLDHVRIDVKTDADGALRVMEVNGIPGLKPKKSWGPQLFTLHHRSPGGELEDYRQLVKTIIDAACRRVGLHPLSRAASAVRVNHSSTSVIADAGYRRRSPSITRERKSVHRLGVLPRRDPVAEHRCCLFRLGRQAIDDADHFLR